MERRDEIEAAFRRLPLLPDAEPELRRTVGLLAVMASTGASSVNPNPFYPSSRRTTASELHALRSAAQRLVRSSNAENRRRLGMLIDTLHEPAVVALADAGFIERVKLRDMLVSALADNDALRLLLERLERTAQAAIVAGVPRAPTKGAHRKDRARAVAEILAREYRLVVGKPPTITVDPVTSAAGGAFLRLVEDVYHALEIDASSEAMARAVIGDAKKKQKVRNALNARRNLDR